jgi:signal peptidase I
MGWAVERQIRAGRRYVFHPTMGVGVIEVDKAGKRHGAAAYEPQMNAFSVAFVGLVPGAGNLWMRQWIRGTALAVPGLILLLIVLATWTESSSNFWVGVLAALMAFSYDCAAKNRRQLRGDDYDFSTRLQMLGLLALAIAGLAVLLRLVPFYWTFQIDSRKCEPFLRNGDIVLFNKWPAFVGGVKKGDVICYAAKRFGFLDAQGLSGNVQEESRIGRVLAVAGDTVEIRDRKIRVNNQELPDSAPIYSSIKPIAMPSRALNSGEWWVLYGNIQSDHAIAAYAGDWTAPADWNGLPEGARLHAQSWSDACVVEKRQIIGVATAVLFPPERRRWLR